MQAKAARKAETIAQQKASPNYEAGLKKMAENSEKAHKASLKRVAKRDVNKAGYQRALKTLQEYTPEKLQGVINSSKSSNVEKKVAQDLLANLK